MKVKKVTRNADYVRFSVTLDMEQDGLKVEANICGGLNDAVYNGIRVQFIEDPEPDYTFYVFGQETKTKAFEELYGKLFAGSYQDFDEELDEICLKALDDIYPYTPSNLSNSDKLKVVNNLRKKSELVHDHLGNEYYTRCYGINEILMSITGYSRQYIGFTKSTGEKSWGMPVEVVKRALKVLKDD